MLSLSAPALLKIRDGITVNLSLSTSQSVERESTQWKLKEGVVKATSREDYESYIADAVTFWFIDGKSLVYRVGEEISEEDFVRISAQIKAIQYRPKSK